MTKKTGPKRPPISPEMDAARARLDRAIDLTGRNLARCEVRAEPVSPTDVAVVFLDKAVSEGPDGIEVLRIEMPLPKARRLLDDLARAVADAESYGR